MQFTSPAVTKRKGHVMTEKRLPSPGQKERPHQKQLGLLASRTNINGPFPGEPTHSQGIIALSSWSGISEQSTVLPKVFM
ncbi:uncharacterized protein [Symphalangus syndactylus]|uniref:uncharacterized protein isoform X3 n=1 Tax=Symphalangus syndactylus TaxID=9590 RepID=UPI0030054891